MARDEVRVGILGLGVVGGGLFQILRDNSAEIEQRVRDTTGTLDQENLTVTVTNAEGDPGDSVIVDVSYAYSLMTPMADLMALVSGGTISDSLTLSSTADMRLE